VIADKSGNLITASADKTCAIIDPISGFKKRGFLKCTDAVYCLLSVYNLTVAGTGDGNIQVFDNDTQECLYGFGAMGQGAVRCMKATPNFDRLVVAGDDPTSLLLNFEGNHIY
jgi:WD40 repeat protein